MLPTRCRGSRPLKRLTDSPSGPRPLAARTSSTARQMPCAASSARRVKTEEPSRPARRAGRRQAEPERRRLGPGDQRPHQDRGDHDRHAVGLPEDHDRPPHRRVGDHHVGRPAREHAAQVGDLRRERVDQPFAHHRDHPPTAGARAPGAGIEPLQSPQRPAHVDLLEAEQLHVLALQRRPRPLAGVERDLVAAFAQRGGEPEMRQQVSLQRPGGEQEAAHGSVSATGAWPPSRVRRSRRRMCPEK